LRVLYVHSGNIFGGVETLMLTLVKHQSVCPEMEPVFALCFAGRFSEELAALGATVHQLGNVRTSKPLSVRRARRNLRDLLKHEGFDVVVVHSTWSQAIFGPVVHTFNLPLVFWLHDVNDGMPWLERWARWSRPPAVVVCNSQYTADRLPKIYPKIKTQLIYCPVAPPDKTYEKDELDQLRDELQTPRAAVVILQISRLEPHKGHLTHLEALARLRDLPGWVCWQVGSVQKPDERRYFEMIQDAAFRLGIDDRVRFLGWQPDIQKVIAAADVYCQPNLYPEPFGITFIEALYAGKPVVATALGGPKEIVDQSCGFLVPANDPTAVAGSLRLLLAEASLRERLGNQGPARARAICDVAIQMNRLQSCFKQVGHASLPDSTSANLVSTP
jgi:glycosyltransferase involved in cell wall biosynthesis